MGRISERIRYVGVNDLQKVIFEGMWPLPFGVSYNSYLVISDKVALIDTVEAGFAAEYMDNIRKELGDRKVDYLVVNHMEPDHSSLIRLVREAWPDVRIVGNAKTVPMIKGYHGIADNIHIVKEGDSISLGDCTLTFYMAPMVHWPETMVTYLNEEKTLFSGDAFGTFGAVDGGIQDQTARLMGSSDSALDTFDAFRDEMRRYYSNIVGKFGQTVQAALKKLSGLEISRICATHGPVWEKNIPEVISYYDRLSRYDADNGVCIAYASMYGNTENAVNVLAAELAEAGVKNIAMYDVSSTHVSELIAEVFRCSHLVLAAPTYNNGIYPAMLNFLHDMKALNVQNRTVALMENGSWAPSSGKQMRALLEEMKGMEILEPVLTVKSALKEKALDSVKEMADTIAKSLNA